MTDASAAASPRTPGTARARLIFRVVAFAEALSWLGLLIGMFFKYVPETTEMGVTVFGPIHGVIFIAYVVVTLWASRVFRWTPMELILGLLASLPPFCTAIFEVVMDRRGRLGIAAGAPAVDKVRA
ncbi:DUF3817 domain-containing protein [Dermacoccaceae bacterium W4C1]